MDYRNLQMSVRTMYNRTLRQKDILTVGGDYMRDYLHTYQFSDGKERVQYTGDLYAQYDCFLGKRWELIGAGRWDYFSDAKGASQLTGKLAARYNLDSFVLRAGYAGGFRAPTLKERYSYFNMVGDIYVKGNEALEAERSHNFNLSAEYTWQNYNLSASASYNTITNRITSSAPQRGTMGDHYVQYINLPSARVLGVELLATAQWYLTGGHRVKARANYVFTREWLSQGGMTPYCPARPHSFNLRLDWDKQWTSFYGTTLSVSGRVLSAVDYETVQMDYPYTPRHVHNPAYTIWKLQLQNRLGKGICLNVAVDNVFNYAPEVYYFNSPVTLGINLMAGISVDVERLWEWKSASK
jgi:outer membrane receptor for ferrienterochelin and colicins